MTRVSSILIVIALTACGRGKEQQPGTGTSTRGGKTVARAALYPENDAIAIMRALDTAEIVTSRVARDVSQNDDVLGYAIVMIRDHGDITRLLDQAGAPARENAISQKLRRDGDSIAHALSVVPVGFNNTYIEEQVKMHEQALQLLDTAVTPSVRTPQLHTLMQQLRPTLLAHLQRAMQLLAIRKKEFAERGEEWISGFNVTAPPPQPRPEPVETIPAKVDTIPTTTTSNN